MTFLQVPPTLHFKMGTLLALIPCKSTTHTTSHLHHKKNNIGGYPNKKGISKKSYDNLGRKKRPSIIVEIVVLDKVPPTSKGPLLFVDLALCFTISIEINTKSCEVKTKILLYSWATACFIDEEFEQHQKIHLLIRSIQKDKGLLLVSWMKSLRKPKDPPCEKSKSNYSRSSGWPTTCFRQQSLWDSIIEGIYLSIAKRQEWPSTLYNARQIHSHRITLALDAQSWHRLEISTCDL